MGELLPNAQQTFLDENGDPLAGGFVYFYVPGTTTPKDTWQDSSGNVLNTNPIVLDQAGRAIIYGDGQYRELLLKNDGALVWDQITGVPDSIPPVPTNPGGLVYASDFGLRTSGNDCAAIQDAINHAAGIGGATVYLGPGPISLTADCSIGWPSNGSGVSLAGDGDCTVINIAGNQHLDLFLMSSLTGCHIRDMLINYTGNSGSGVVINFINCTDSLVSNVRITGACNIGVAVNGTPGSTIIENVVIEGAANVGFQLGVGGGPSISQDIYVDDCRIQGSLTGISIFNAKGVKISNCALRNNPVDGLIISPPTGLNVEDVSILNLSVDNCGGNAITIGALGGGGTTHRISISGGSVTTCGGNAVEVASNASTQAISIRGMNIAAAGFHGILSHGAGALIIADNVIMGIGTHTDNTYTGIIVTDGPYNVISGNFTGGGAGYPLHQAFSIVIAGTTDFTAVVANSIGGGMSGTIANTASGTNNIVTNNAGA